MGHGSDPSRGGVDGKMELQDQLGEVFKWGVGGAFCYPTPFTALVISPGSFDSHHHLHVRF